MSRIYPKNWDILPQIGQICREMCTTFGIVRLLLRNYTMLDAELQTLNTKLEQTRDAAAASIRAVEAEIAERRKTVSIAADFRAAELRHAQPVKQGTLEDLLVHHLGHRALAEDFVAPLRRLAARLQQEGEEQATAAVADHEPAVPVLFTSQERVSDRDGDFVLHRVALVRVAGTELHAPFQSTAAVQQMSMHAFSNKMADVETLRLSLVGSTATARGTLKEAALGDVKRTNSFLLHETQTAAGGQGAGWPSDYAFRDSVADEALNLRRDPQLTSRCMVGWSEIEAAIVTSHGTASLTVYKNFLTLARGAGFTTFGSGESKLGRVLGRLAEIERLEQETRSALAEW